MSPENFLYLVLITLIPSIELRGSIPVGVFLLEMDPLTVALTAIIVNILLIVPLFFFLDLFFPLLQKISLFNKYLLWLQSRTKEKVERYGFWALTLFVAVPLPGTGAYTGVLAAKLFNVDRKKSFFAISLGVLIAGILVTLAVIGVTGLGFILT